jgi:hypothetical protein
LFERSCHLIKDFCQLTEFAASIVHTGARAHLTGGKPSARLRHGLNLTHDKQIAAEPGRQHGHQGNDSKQGQVAVRRIRLESANANSGEFRESCKPAVF